MRKHPRTHLLKHFLTAEQHLTMASFKFSEVQRIRNFAFTLPLTLRGMKGLGGMYESLKEQSFGSSFHRQLLKLRIPPELKKNIFSMGDKTKVVNQ